MQTRTYKDTGEQIPLLGFGFMRLQCKDEANHEIDAPKAFEMVDFAIANGVNYFDTAYMYHGGASELVLGEALSRYPRESFYIADKMPPWYIKSQSDVSKIFEEQLKKCKVDYFDFYLMHNTSRENLKVFRQYNVYDFLLEKKAEGKIRHLGFSFHDRVDLLEEIMAEYSFDFAQIQLNYLDWELQNAKREYEILTERGIPVIVMEPVRGGALHTLNPGAVEILKFANPKVSAASWALRFAASLPGVLTVLSGMSNMDQLKDNIRTMSEFTPLTDEERSVIDRAVAEYRLGAPVPCTACGYCMPCPAGVDIPRVFACYNHHRAGGSEIAFWTDLDVLGGEKQPNNCTECGSCLSKCPQQIEIPEWMGKIDKIAQTL